MRGIASLRRLDETILRTGGSGDNWHMTWADDDRLYARLCDGTGWPGMPQADYNSRVYAIDGSPPDVTFQFLPGFPDLVNDWGTRECSRYYSFGILALSGRIYLFLSAPNRPFTQPAPRFVGAKLIYSPDDGRTWRNQDGSTPVVWETWEERSKENMAFFEEPGDAFSLLTILQMGRDYRDNTDVFSGRDFRQVGFGAIFFQLTGLPPTPENIAANPQAAATALALSGVSCSPETGPACNPLLGLQPLQFLPPFLILADCPQRLIPAGRKAAAGRHRQDLPPGSQPPAQFAGAEQVHKIGLALGKSRGRNITAGNDGAVGRWRHIHHPCQVAVHRTP